MTPGVNVPKSQWIATRQQAKDMSGLSFDGAGRGPSLSTAGVRLPLQNVIDKSGIASKTLSLSRRRTMATVRLPIKATAFRQIHIAATAIVARVRRMTLSAFLNLAGKLVALITMAIGLLVGSALAQTQGTGECDLLTSARLTRSTTYAEESEIYNNLVEMSFNCQKAYEEAESQVAWFKQADFFLNQLIILNQRLSSASGDTKSDLEADKKNLLENDIFREENLIFFNGRGVLTTSPSVDEANEIEEYLKKDEAKEAELLKTELHDQSTLRDVSREIDERLNQATPDQTFKLYISIGFAGLVGVVIVGFFIMSWRDPEIGRTIFAGDSGLQFIALFVVIIAIILFGVVEILDAKELAALLGGLSGYILGRSNAGGHSQVIEAQKASTVTSPA
jgi:hypothetical protein